MFTIPRFATRRARSNGSVNFTSRNGPIELDHLRKLAPSIFAETPHSSRSDRYAYIPTSTVLDGLMKEGFQPFAVMQGGTRDEEKRGFTKHLIRLRHQSQTVQVGGTHNEILLMNSHDGTSSYRLSAGVFRLVCANGMVVAESLIDDLRISHKGDVQGLVIDGCIDLLDRLPEVSESVREMESLQLSTAEQRAFGIAALELRYADKESPISPTQVIAARRREDAAGTLWQTLNVTQENIIRGGVSYVQEDQQGRRQRRSTREIHGIDQNTSLNRGLWRLAEEMKKIKAMA
ncbi:MAG TPA: DUF932 domain-containing protein [Luteolibacter sp.]